MVELKAVVTCDCGKGDIINGPEGGQSLFGTACFQAVNHSERCRGTAKVKPRFVDNE